MLLESDLNIEIKNNLKSGMINYYPEGWGMGEGVVFASLFQKTDRLIGNNGNINTQRIEIICVAERLQHSNTAKK